MILIQPHVLVESKEVHANIVINHKQESDEV